MMTWRWRVGQAVLVCLSILFVAQESGEGATVTAPFSCWIADISADTTPYKSVYIPDEGLVIAIRNDISFIHRVKDQLQAEDLTASVAAQNYPGTVYDLVNFSENQVLVNAQNGYFLIEINPNKAVITILHRKQPSSWQTYSQISEIPGAGILIWDDKGWLFAYRTSQGIKMSPLNTQLQGFYTSVEVPGFGALILGFPLFAPRFNHAIPDRSRLFASKSYSVSSSTTTVAPKVLATIEPNQGFVFIKPLAENVTGGVYVGYNLAGLGAFIGANNGDFLATSEHGRLDFIPIINGDVGAIYSSYDISSNAVLVATSKGLFEAVRNKTSLIIVPVSGSKTGFVGAFHSALGGGILAAAQNGLFLIRNVAGQEEASPVAGDETGQVRTFTDVPGVGLVIGAAKGLFLFHAVGADFRADKIDTGEINLTFINSIFPITGGDGLPAIAVYVVAANDLWLGDLMPLSGRNGAIVNLPERANFDDYVFSSAQTVKLDFTVEHDCADVASDMGFQVRVTAPDGSQSIITPDDVDMSTNENVAYLTASVRVNSPGNWSFQVVSKTDGDALVGQVQYLNFKAPARPAAISLASLVALWPGILVCFSLFMVFASATLFLAARYSPRAWRLVTDDIVGAWVFPLATWLMSHFSWAQLWILDQYFQRRRAQIDPPAPFLALPLTDKHGKTADCNTIAGPPWAHHRLWIQGNSGMGKTALFQHVVEMHFRDHKTAFSAFVKWGCLVVAFAARDFADGGEDRQEPDWVIGAVRATLSRRGITFSDDRLLLRMLETGTIGVAIDGLNEAGRTRAIAAFCSRFGSTPMLVTSQYPGDHPFQTWRLPDDAGGFIEAMLSLHLGEDSTAIMLDRIMKSKLVDSKLSGYDIRLIIDLARSDPTGATLPSNRMELYREVVDRGWPLNGPERQAEEQRRTAAAAWRMVSERRPNEDMRRLRPDVDLAAELLAELADAPEKYHRPVRLIRRTTGAFEFVHDQMHSFLAARWLTQDGFSVVEITRMLQVSTIWTQSTDARKTLWGFVAALLDSERLLALWRRIEDLDDWDALRRALKAEAELRNG